jgi:hypothetical protein
MLNIDRVWSRVSQLPNYRGKKITDFILNQINYATQLTTGQASPNNVVTFPAGAIVVGVRAGACLDAAVATQTTRDGLDLFKLSIADQQTGRAISGTLQAMASAIFGRFNDQFPAKELIIPAQGGLLYSLTNLTTSTIDVFISHDCLVPNAIG